MGGPGEDVGRGSSPRRHLRRCGVAAPTTTTEALSLVPPVATGKYSTLGESPQLAVYLPLDQWPQRTVTLHVRTATDPLALVRLAMHLNGATFVPRVGVRVIGFFAAAALALAALVAKCVLQLDEQLVREKAPAPAVHKGAGYVAGHEVARDVVVVDDEQVA